jgi:serine/threonine protein phosphatase PrpC
MSRGWQSAQQSHRGKRRQHNEDAVLGRPHAGLWAVADGMGGHQAGDVASHAIVAALADLVLAGPLSRRVDAVDDALMLVNDQLRLHAGSRGPGITIGSTVVAMVVEGGTAAVLWAGDSRLYRWRAGHLALVTRDHNPISDLLEGGSISEAEALAADTNIITRAVGAQPRLVLDVALLNVAADDIYLLCSDGFYRGLDLEHTAHTLALEEPLERMAELLLDRCLAGPADDNISLVLARRERR